MNEPGSDSWRTGPPRRWRKAATIVFAICALYLLYPMWVYDSWTSPVHFTSSNSRQKLHILIPASQSNSKLCKCILSAHILQYPTPVLINWKRESDFQRPDWRANGTHIDKLLGISRYLNAQGKAADAEYVAVIDGYDTWFQLPPSVLIERYHQANKRYTRLIPDIVGQDVAHAKNLRQSILFTAQKKCGPQNSGGLKDSSPGCYAVPPNPLPDDLYGPYTDVNDAEWPWRVRPRWLCSGFVMGQVKDMRVMFNAAADLVPSFNHGGSDQLIFAKLFGEQWYQRHAMETLGQGADALASSRIPAALLSQTSEEDLTSMSPVDDMSLEYSIGLDYNMEISHSQVYSETDARFLIYNDSMDLIPQQTLGSVETSMGYELPVENMSTSLPEDILSLPSPFASLDDGGDTEKKTVGWIDVPLYTNLFTRKVPVTIHMNGMKRKLNELWSRMWYYPQLDQFFAAEERRRSVGAFDDQGNFVDWYTLCGDIEHEIFQ